MCFLSPPKPKPVIEDPTLKAEQERARKDAQAVRSATKEKQTTAEIYAQTGRVGRASLLSGASGGTGFGAMARTLLAKVQG